MIHKFSRKQDKRHFIPPTLQAQGCRKGLRSYFEVPGQRTLGALAGYAGAYPMRLAELAEAVLRSFADRFPC